MKKTTINRQLLSECLAPSKSEALYIIICRIGDQNMTADKKNFRTYTFYLTNPDFFQINAFLYKCPLFTAAVTLLYFRSLKFLFLT